MAKPGCHVEPANDKLTRVYEGMRVYSRTGSKIGTVAYLHRGELAEADDENGQEPAALTVLDGSEGSFIEDYARTVILTERVPDRVRDQLLHQGFIKVNSTGLFASGRYVLPEQIASVSSAGVTLHISRNELTKL